MAIWYAQNGGDFTGITWNDAPDGNGNIGWPSSGDTLIWNGYDISMASTPYNGYTYVVGANKLTIAGSVSFDSGSTLSMDGGTVDILNSATFHFLAAGQNGGNNGLGTWIVRNGGSLVVSYGGFRYSVNIVLHPGGALVGGQLFSAGGSISVAVSATEYSDPGVDQVQSGTQYYFAGTQLTGTLSGNGGGYTYGDSDPSKVLTTATGAGSYQPVAASNVRYNTAVGVSPAVGTCHVPTAANTASGVSVDVSDTGTFTHTSDYVAKTDVVAADYVLTGHSNYSGGSSGTLTLPGVGYVSTSAGNWGAGGNGSTGTLDMGTYTLKSSVVSAAYVVTGHDNYTGGSAGSYPTTATSYAAGQANQLATDQAAASAASAYIVTGHTLLGANGSYPTSATTAASQLATDQAAVLASAEYIVSGHSILGQDGTYEPESSYPTIMQGGQAVVASPDTITIPTTGQVEAGVHFFDVGGAEDMVGTLQAGSGGGGSGTGMGGAVCLGLGL